MPAAVAAGWADQGTAPGVQDRDLVWEVAEDQEVRVPAAVVEPAVAAALG